MISSGRPPVDPAVVSFFEIVQTILCKRRIDLARPLSRICAVDASYAGSRILSVAKLFENGRLKETAEYSGDCVFPYISGLFYLREGPFVTETVRRLRERPQLICFDAHGAAHPRSAGLATVCGMVLGIPSIGIAKSSLVGEEVESTSRGFTKLVHRGKIVGLVTIESGTRRYWSPGFSVSLAQLKGILAKHRSVCEEAMRESDAASRREIRRVT